MLKKEKSANRNDHQNRKTEVFCNKNRKTEIPKAPLCKEVRFEKLKIQPRRSSKAVRSI